MSNQYNKVIKRKRRKAYLKRRNLATKATHAAAKAAKGTKASKKDKA